MKAQGEVIAVPYVLCDGAFHESLKSYIGDIISETNIFSRGVLYHDKTVEWVEAVIAKGMNQPPVEEVDRNWAIMDIEEPPTPLRKNRYGFCK